MFEHLTFDVLLERMLDRVPDDIDKREGSVIFDALAPVALEIAETYSMLDVVTGLSFADTADGSYLERRVAEHGVYRKQAVQAVRKVEISDTEGLPHDAVPLGSLFQLDGEEFKITEKTAPGEYKAAASSPGKTGNVGFGEMVPVQSVDRLGSATLQEILIPGEDVESDESLYNRYLRKINEQPFGGNRADYIEKALKIPGVGGIRLFRSPEGGGSVGLMVIDSTYATPSQDLLSRVQEVFDPLENQGDGLGLAPIGHTVLVSGVGSISITVTTKLTLNGVTIGQVEPLVREKLESYLLSLRKSWGRGEAVTVRISHIETRLMEILGVEDIQDTTINGVASNLLVPDNMIPVLGGVSLIGI